MTRLVPNTYPDPYYEGIRARWVGDSEADCPYEPKSLPKSTSDRDKSPMTLRFWWLAGYWDADRVDAEIDYDD